MARTGRVDPRCRCAEVRSQFELPEGALPEAVNTIVDVEVEDYAVSGPPHFTDAYDFESEMNVKDVTIESETLDGGQNAVLIRDGKIAALLHGPYPVADTRLHIVDSGVLCGKVGTGPDDTPFRVYAEVRFDLNTYVTVVQLGTYLKVITDTPLAVLAEAYRQSWEYPQGEHCPAAAEEISKALRLRPAVTVDLRGCGECEGCDDL